MTDYNAIIGSTVQTNPLIPENKMIYSSYQEAIFNAVEQSNSHLIVEAVAGSGKSTTLVEVCKRLKGNNHLFCAFNKLIADDLSKKLPYNIQCRTLNSYGWGICLKNFKVKLDMNKTDNMMKDIVPWNERKYVGGFIKSLIGLLKANTVFPDSLMNGSFDMMELILRQGLDMPKSKQALDWTKEIYQRSAAMTHIMDFDDQIFMPILYDLQLPYFDTLLVDESQDLNPVQIELCIRSAKRLIAVGDSRQAIYGFRGADPEAIANMQSRLAKDICGVKTLPLSICYRCPKKVVEAAKVIVPQIESNDTAEQGVVASCSMSKFDQSALVGDFVLCRTTAPLVSNCLRFIREGRHATVRGRDIGKQLDSLITRISGGVDSKTIDAFLSDLDNYSRAETSRLAALERNLEIQALNDRVATLEALSSAVIDPKGIGTVAGIKQKITEIFSDESSGIVFCTIHKSKGLEAERIWILHPELLPHPAAKKPWQKEQEKNLKYVAITRAQKELYWVS